MGYADVFLLLAIASIAPAFAMVISLNESEPEVAAWRREKSCHNTPRQIQSYDCFEPMSKPGEGAIANLIMASGPKTGSTGMWMDLLKHGMVSYGVTCKEMRFFTNDTHFFGNRTSDWDELAYRRFFKPPCASAELVYTDASPIYWNSPIAARRISLHLPRAKVLIIVREPMKRFISRMVGNYEHQPKSSWLTCRQHIDGFHTRMRECATAWRKGCLFDDQTGAWFPTRTSTGEAMSAVILENLWGKFFDLTGSDGRFLALPLDYFSHDYTPPQRTQAYQFLARFLGIRPWRESELRDIPNMFTEQKMGSSHNEHYEDARSHPGGQWGLNYTAKAGPTWDCSDADISTLQSLFGLDSRRLRRLLNSHVLRRELRLALPSWLIKA